MIRRIDGNDDRLRPYRHVGDPWWLERAGLFVAEGRLVVERLLGMDGYDVESVLLTPAAARALADRLPGAGCEVYVGERQVLREVTGFNFHRGCLALARRPPPRSPDELTRGRRIVALEGVGNPDNVGGIFRAAAALGASGVLLDASTADPLYRKSIRTSMAATLAVPWARAADWGDALERLRRERHAIVALTPGASATPLDEYSLRVNAADRLTLLFGAEGAGLSELSLQLADARVRIPVDPAVDSLNVVVAAGIVLYALR